MRSPAPCFMRRRAMTESARVLFVTWDGPQVSYLEGLFLPIFAGLRRRGYAVHVLQFGWGPDERIARRREACEALGVPYRFQRVLLRPRGVGQLVSVLRGAGAIRQALHDWRIDIAMPRSLMPAWAFQLARPAVPCVFDADGFPADERVEFGSLSPASPTYRMLRRVEARMVRAADRVLVRTPAAAEILADRAGLAPGAGKVSVVVNGRDPAPFAAALAARDRGARPFTACYLGSMGRQYMPDRMLAVAAALRTEIPGFRLKILSRDRAEVDEALRRAGLATADWITVGSVEPEAVPGQLVDCDLGFSFRMDCFATRGVAPIKIGDYLMAGLPILGSAGAGDTSDLVREGVFLDGDGDARDLARRVAQEICPRRDELRRVCHALGADRFSLEASVAQYAQALDGAAGRADRAVTDPSAARRVGAR